MSVKLPLQPANQLRGGLADNVSPLGYPVSEWREGVQYTSQCELDGFIWGCGRSDGDPKALSLLGDTVNFLPTTLGGAASCDVAGSRSLIGNRQQQVALGVLERTQWQQLAQVLHDGFIGVGAGGTDVENPNFYASATVSANQSYTAPSSIAATLEGMYDTYCNRYSGDVLVHVPQQFRAFWIEQRLVEFDRASNRYYMGNTPVSFDCYSNVGPASAADPTPPVLDDGSAFWMYMSSVPIVEMDVVEEYDYTDVRQNSYTAVAERGAIALFDPCSVVAGLASVYPTGL